MIRITLFLCCLLSAAIMVMGCGPAVPRFTTHSLPTTEASPASAYQLEGIASYYAEEFSGRKTSNGEVYDIHGLTAAHRTLPFNTRIRVVNKENGRSVIVRINDRGPFKDNRVVDLSLEAAKELGLLENGTAPVRIEVLELGSEGK